VTLVIRPLTPEVWPAFEDLFGRAGASNGCWCMYWRLGPAYRDRERTQNRDDLRTIVRRGPPPGLVAFDGDHAVGWCRVTPRTALPNVEHRPLTRPVDDAPVWVISCFYVRKTHRRHGVSEALIRAALKAAKRAHAPGVEAYPVETAHPGATSNLYTGVASAFARAGFRKVAQRAGGRPVMRHDLKGIRGSAGRSMADPQSTRAHMQKAAG
jgi:GNAT superfamily N-acetyltransferase